jgi:hypothetical protein
VGFYRRRRRAPRWGYADDEGRSSGCISTAFLGEPEGVPRARGVSRSIAGDIEVLEFDSSPAKHSDENAPAGFSLMVLFALEFIVLIPGTEGSFGHLLIIDDKHVVVPADSL